MKGYTQTYVSVVDREIPSTYEVEKCRLLNKIETQLGEHYMISYKEEPIDFHPYILDAVIDQFKREDGEYSYRGNLMSRSTITEILRERYYALVLTCVTMETVPANYKVIEFGNKENDEC